MTPKEKAIELFDKYYTHQWQVHKSTRTYKITGLTKSAAKYFTLIAVDEILALLPEIAFGANVYEYWQQVRKEIEQL